MIIKFQLFYNRLTNEIERKAADKIKFGIKIKKQNNNKNYTNLCKYVSVQTKKKISLAMQLLAYWHNVYVQSEQNRNLNFRE